MSTAKKRKMHLVLGDYMKIVNKKFKCSFNLFCNLRNGFRSLFLTITSFVVSKSPVTFKMNHFYMHRPNLPVLLLFQNISNGV